MSTPKTIPLEFRRFPENVMTANARDFSVRIQRRRTVRDFSDEPVPIAILEDCLRAAGSAPSGANMQPWHFVVVKDPSLKTEIRRGAEEEERAFYRERAPEEWLEALQPLGTNENKPFLEIAPYLVVIFAEAYGVLEGGRQRKHYYVQESVGIATGILITALHEAGLATLTHTPSPMKFLNKILGRPANERPYLILVVGYPTPDARVPDIHRKPLSEFTTIL